MILFSFLLHFAFYLIFLPAKIRVIRLNNAHVTKIASYTGQTDSELFSVIFISIKLKYPSEHTTVIQILTENLSIIVIYKFPSEYAVSTKIVEASSVVKMSMDKICIGRNQTKIKWNGIFYNKRWLGIYCVLLILCWDSFRRVSFSDVLASNIFGVLGSRGI